MTNEKEQPISELFMACTHVMKEFAPLKGKGIVTKVFPEKHMEIKCTADEGMIDKNDGRIRVEAGEMQRFTFYIWKRGWLIAMVSPYAGTFIHGQEIHSEDDLIAEIKALVAQ